MILNTTILYCVYFLVIFFQWLEPIQKSPLSDDQEDFFKQIILTIHHRSYSARPLLLSTV